MDGSRLTSDAVSYLRRKESSEIRLRNLKTCMKISWSWCCNLVLNLGLMGLNS